MRQAVLLLSVVLAGSCLLAREAIAQNGGVSGRVTSNGAPVAGAQVSVEGVGRGTLTDSRGLYLIRGLQAGTHTVRTQSIGYEAAEATVTVSADESVVQNFALNEQAVQLERITVTVGSRARVTAAEELAVPVDVFTRADIVESTPQLETTSILRELSPSVYFARPQVSDLTSGVRPFQLRGLSPDHSLVLINGKRRHQTAVVHVFGAAGGGSGSSGVDMNTIVPAAIGGMEILRDGAAAQYGSDAIAGVINVQLRRDIHDPELQVSLGQYRPDEFDADGERIEATGSWGLPLADRGSLVLSGMFSDRAETNRAGPDRRDQIIDGDADEIECEPGEACEIVGKNNPVGQPSRLLGDGETTNVGGSYNLNYALGENQLHELYSFGGYSFRRDLHAGNFRRAIQPQNWPEIYPEGFLPKFRGDNQDLMAVAGVRGPLGSWQYDLSAQWNRNRIDTDIFDSHNASLGPSLTEVTAPGPWPEGVEPMPNQTEFFAGALEANQAIASFDVVREVEAGLPSPVNVALGTSFRADNFQLIAGEPASWVNGSHPDRDGGIAEAGSQVFTGFRPDQEVDEWRTNIGVYADVESNVTPWLRLAGATRFENYSDFGSTLTGKLAARVQAAEQFILRGAVSTGFRAPNPNQSFYGHVSTGFRTDTITGDQVPYQIGEVPVASESARGLGAEPLKEETSVNLSAGVAWSPTENLTFTVDGYQIELDDRIILTGSLSGPTVERLLASLNAPTVKFFTNSIDTRTRGLDVSARYRHILDVDRYVEVLGQYNRNTLKVIDVRVPDVIEEIRDQVFDSGDEFTMVNGRPKDRGLLRLRYGQGRFQANVSGNYYGRQVNRLEEDLDRDLALEPPNEENPLGGLCVGSEPDLRCVETATGAFDILLDNGPHFLLDAEASFELRNGLSIAIGAENLTDQNPPAIPVGQDSNGQVPFFTGSAVSVNGRYIYTKLQLSL